MSELEQISNAKKGAIFTVALILFGFSAGMGLGWKLWKPKPPIQETAAPAVRNSDGSLTVARTPETVAQAQQVFQTPVLPKGAKVERKIEVTVQPTQATQVPALPQEGPAMSQNKAATPPEVKLGSPIRVDLTLVLMPDQTQRVIASSPDGTVVGGIDIPLVPDAPPPKQLKSAAGMELSLNPWGNTKSLVAQHDWAFMRFGARVGVATMTFPAGGMQRGIDAGVSLLIKF